MEDLPLPIYILSVIIGSLIWGFATAAVRDQKGYGRNWFWFGFFLGLPPFIIACAIPARQPDPYETYTPGGLTESLAYKSAEQPHTSLFSDEDYVQKTVAAGGWKCFCGRANPAYVSTCTCGLNKRQNSPSDNAYADRVARKKAREEAIASELKKYKVMLDSMVISQEEYNARVSELFKSANQ